MTDPRLTDREREVARLVSQGMTNRQIAEELGLAVKTVDHYSASAREKLGVTTRTQVACWVLERRAERAERALAELADWALDAGGWRLFYYAEAPPPGIFDLTDRINPQLVPDLERHLAAERRDDGSER